MSPRKHIGAMVPSTDTALRALGLGRLLENLTPARPAPAAR